jgi:NodT family efflux transporter outer membrane factor (OMF) lipoprotein
LSRAGLVAAIAAAIALSGCMVGPDFQRPAPPDVEGYTTEPLAEHTASAAVAGGAPQNFLADKDIPGEWWALFHSRPLNDLVEEALKANPDLDAAHAALRQAKENVYAEQGSLYPEVDASLSVSRQKISKAPAGESLTYSLFNASVPVSYTPDVFGGTRRQIESLEAQAENQRFQLEAAYLTVTSNVVTAAIQDASLRAQIAATEDIIRAESQQLDVLRQQFALGGVSKSDVLSQEATLRQAQATLPPLQKQLAQNRNLLTALAGRFPSRDRGEIFQLADLTLPEDLPVSLPSKLVEQRPDVQAAEATMHSTSAEIGVARANQFPQFTLSADVGTAATQVGSLATPGTAAWSVAATVLQPLFDAGTRLHRKRAAVAAYDEAAAQYRSTVLTAFQNVADTLRALQSDADALKAQVAAERSAADSLAIARQQFKVGAISYPSLLNAQETYLRTRISLVQAQATRYADTAALFQALGGGWWNRADVTADAGGGRQSEDARADGERAP